MHHGSCGIKINGENAKTKTAIKNAVKNGDEILIKAFSPFGTEYFTSKDLAGISQADFFGAGPDPEVARNYFFHISVKNGKITVK